MLDMPDWTTQQQLADAIGYSQGRVSEATGSEDLLYPDFLDEPFDPDEHAVEKGDQFQGYDPSRLPEPVRRRLGEETSEDADENGRSQKDQEALSTVATPELAPSIQNADQVFLPTKAVNVGARPTSTLAERPYRAFRDQPGTSEFLSGNEVHLQKEQTNASVIPKGTDVSRSVAYGSVAHVTETAVRQDPALAWAALGLTGGGIGAFAGYQAEGTTKGMAAGAAAGTAVTLASGLIGVAASA